MKQLLATRLIYLFIYFLALGCVKHQPSSSDLYKIINLELKRNLSLFDTWNIEVYINLENFLDSNISIITDMVNHFILNDNEDEILCNFRLINTQNQISFLELPIKEEINDSLLILGKKAIFRKENVIEYKKEIFDDGKKFIYLSRPRFANNHKIAVIAYAIGSKSSMQRGINLYYKQEGNWKFCKSLKVWLE